MSALPAPIALGSAFGAARWRDAEHPHGGRRLRLARGTMMAATTAVVLADGAILFLLAWEVMAPSASFPICTEEERAAVRAASWTHRVATHAGALCLIGFFASLARAGGSPALWPALGGALVHARNHALVKPLLLLAAGCALHAAGTRRTSAPGGLAGTMARTFAPFAVGAVAVSDLPRLDGLAGGLLLHVGLSRATAAAPAPCAASGGAAPAATALVPLDGIARPPFRSGDRRLSRVRVLQRGPVQAHLVRVLPTVVVVLVLAR